MAKIKYNQIEDINTLTEKVNIVPGDFMIIEDSQDAFKNKKLNVLNLPSATDSNYVYDQPLVSATWNITHGLTKFTSVTIVDTSGNEVEGEVNHIDNNNLTITFSSPFSGKAYIN